MRIASASSLKMFHLTNLFIMYKLNSRASYIAMQTHLKTRANKAFYAFCAGVKKNDALLAKPVRFILRIYNKTYYVWRTGIKMACVEKSSFA